MHERGPRRVGEAGVAGRRPNNGPKALRVTDRAIKLMIDAGFTGMDQAYAASLLTAHAIGAGVVEGAWHQAIATSGLTAEELTASVTAYQNSIGKDYPHTDQWWRANQLITISKVQEDGFAFGLERLLDGLDAWLRRPLA